MRIPAIALVVAMVLVLGSLPLSAQQPPKMAKLTMAVVAGGETKGLKAILPMWEKEKGVKIDLVEFPMAR